MEKRKISFLKFDNAIFYNMMKQRNAYIGIEEDTRDKLKTLKKEKTYDQFFNEILDRL